MLTHWYLLNRMVPAKGKGHADDKKTIIGIPRRPRYVIWCYLVHSCAYVNRSRVLEWPVICEVMKSIDDIGYPQKFYDELLQDSYKNLPKLRWVLCCLLYLLSNSVKAWQDDIVIWFTRWWSIHDQPSGALHARSWHWVCHIYPICNIMQLTWSLW
jgi:hypothetical protein